MLRGASLRQTDDGMMDCTCAAFSLIRPRLVLALFSHDALISLDFAMRTLHRLPLIHGDQSRSHPQAIKEKSDIVPVQARVHGRLLDRLLCSKALDEAKQVSCV